MKDQPARAHILKHLAEGLVRGTYSKVKTRWHSKKEKKKKSKTLHAKRGGLFRCQEVCVMVMGQMREEGWSRPLCFEDSPSPPRPVQPHPKTKEQTRSKRAYLCVHMPLYALVLVCYIFLGLWVQQANKKLYSIGGKWTAKFTSQIQPADYSASPGSWFQQTTEKNLSQTGRWLVSRNCNPTRRTKQD